MDVPAGVACFSETLSESKPRLAMNQWRPESPTLSGLRGGERRAEHFDDTLFSSIERMIYKVCRSHSSVCDETAEDLVHDCTLNISKQIAKYNPELSSFTTWCWHLCRNTLISKTRRAKKRVVLCYRGFANENHYDNRLFADHPGYPAKVYSFEIRDAVHDLLKQNPKQRQMVFAMFGNPRAKDYSAPDEIKICQVARACNVPYHEAYLFYRNIVRPFFKKRFAE